MTISALGRFRLHGTRVSDDDNVSPEARAALAGPRLVSDRTEDTESGSSGAEVAGERDGGIVTIDVSSPLFLPPEWQNRMLLYRGGLLMVEATVASSNELASLERQAQREGITVARTVSCSFEEIRAEYARAGLPRGVNGTVVQHTEKQAHLRRMLDEAVKRGASDVHIKVAHGKGATLHFTLLGEYVRQSDLDEADAEALINAAVAAAKDGDRNARANEFRQFGLSNSADFVLPKGVEALRLQVSPVAGGTELVARILREEQESGLSDLKALGYEPMQVEAVDVMRRQAFGTIIISGPVGSGKSTTLKVCLEQTYWETAGRKKIITIEDPREYNIRGATQYDLQSGDSEEDKARRIEVAINGLVRSASDITMIGEIREAVVARGAMRVAKLGQLLYTTVHANSALDIVPRILDLGVRPVDVADPALVRGLIGQRLIRTLCPHCKRPAEAASLPAHLQHWFAGLPKAARANVFMANPDGCDHCSAKNGHEGRIGRAVVAETVLPRHEVLDHMVAGNHRLARETWLSEPGTLTMLEHALLRVVRGEVDLRDIATVGDVTRELKPERVERVVTLAGQRQGVLL